MIFLFFSTYVSYPSVYWHLKHLIHIHHRLYNFCTSLKTHKNCFGWRPHFLSPHFVKSISVEWPDSLSLPFRIFWITCTVLALASSWRDATDVLIQPPLWRPYRHQTIGLWRNNRTLNIYRCIYYILKWYEFTIIFFHDTNNFLNLFYLKKWKHIF